MPKVNVDLKLNMSELVSCLNVLDYFDLDAAKDSGSIDGFVPFYKCKFCGDRFKIISEDLSDFRIKYHLMTHLFEEELDVIKKMLDEKLNKIKGK